MSVVAERGQAAGAVGKKRVFEGWRLKKGTTGAILDFFRFLKS